MSYYDDGYRAGNLPAIQGCSTGNEENIDLESDELRPECGESFGPPARVSRLNDDIFTLHISQLS